MDFVELVNIFGLSNNHTFEPIIMVCTYLLVMISIDLSELTLCTGNPRQRLIFLGLNFVSDFVWDYILQLYFICNHLISLIRLFSLNFRLAYFFKSDQRVKQVSTREKREHVFLLQTMK